MELCDLTLFLFSVGFMRHSLSFSSFLQVAPRQCLDRHNSATNINIDQADRSVCPQIWTNLLSVGHMFYWVLVMCANLLFQGIQWQSNGKKLCLCWLFHHCKMLWQWGHFGICAAKSSLHWKCHPLVRFCISHQWWHLSFSRWICCYFRALNNNQLQGPIPEAISSLVKLTYLWVTSLFLSVGSIISTF